MIWLVLNFNGKVPWLNDEFVSQAIMCKITLCADFITEVDTKSNSDDFSGIDLDLIQCHVGDVVQSGVHVWWVRHQQIWSSAAVYDSDRYSVIEDIFHKEYLCYIT